MASASLPRRKNLSAQQALALLLDMDALDSDGGEVSFAQQLTDISSEESEMETEQEPNMPPRKMRRGTGKSCARQTAKDVAVWVEEDIGSGMPSASAHRSRFTACAGPTEPAKRKITSVLQSFLCLLDKGMLQTIKECTVHQALRTEPDWKLTIHELMAFISILFVRAIMCPASNIMDCWSENFLVPAIKETMSRDRFLSIMQHLRFDDKDTRAERIKTDRFAAISDIWTRFTKNCAESFTPGEHMTIDEQVFPTKVRCPFTQYIASKPNANERKFGIKFWIATDLETKYVCNASPYLGKDPSHQKGERLAENVVMSLMEPFLDDGRNVTTDSFFTSLSLSHRLLQRNTTLLGMVNKVCRELPPLAKDTAEREEFSTSVFRSGSVSLTIYTPKKKRTVCLLSSLHRDVTIGDGRKRKPNTITDYNHMKCGVDVLNQMVRINSVRAATHRWPVAVFYNMLDLAAANAYVLYKACTGWKGKRRLFLSLLAKELRCQFMQQKEMEAERKAAAAFAAAEPGPVRTTQCQVQESCNRNRSRHTCIKCHKPTCAKCRDDSYWVCKRCKHRQTDRLYLRVTIKKKATKSLKKAKKLAAAEKATRSPKKTTRSPVKATRSPKKTTRSPVKATRSPEKATRSLKKATRSPEKATRTPKKATRSPVKTTRSPEKATRSPKKTTRSPVKATRTPKKVTRTPKKVTRTLKKATRSPKKAKAAKPKVAKPKATKAKKAAPKKK